MLSVYYQQKLIKSKMSHFGYNTFEQNLLEHIIEACEDQEIDLLEGVERSMKVISHLSGIAFDRDKALNAMYEQAKQSAKSELIKKMNE